MVKGVAGVSFGIDSAISLCVIGPFAKGLLCSLFGTYVCFVVLVIIGVVCGNI